MLDEYITLLNQALSQRSNIWMFYTIIVTTAFGIAFADSYKKLTVFPRLVLTIAVGTAVWYNFYNIFLNAQYINELVAMIAQAIPDDEPLDRIFGPHGFYETSHAKTIYLIYLPINFALFVAMWWDEVCLFSDWVGEKYPKFCLRKRKK